MNLILHHYIPRHISYILHTMHLTTSVLWRLLNGTCKFHPFTLLKINLVHPHLIWKFGMKGRKTSVTMTRTKRYSLNNWNYIRKLVTYFNLARCSGPLAPILQHVSVHHMVEPPHLCLQRDDALVSGRGYGLTKPVDILLYA